MWKEDRSPSSSIQTLILIAAILELIVSRYVATFYTVYMLFLTAATAFGLSWKKAWLCYPFLLHMIGRQASSMFLGMMFIRDVEVQYAKVVMLFAEATPIPQLTKYYVGLTVISYLSATILNVILVTCMWNVIQSFRSQKLRSIDELFSFPRRHSGGYSPI